MPFRLPPDPAQRQPLLSGLVALVLADLVALLALALACCGVEQR